MAGTFADHHFSRAQLGEHFIRRRDHGHVGVDASRRIEFDQIRLEQDLQATHVQTAGLNAGFDAGRQVLAIRIRFDDGDG